MKSSYFKLLTAILLFQSLLYTILSLGSILDIISFLSTNQQPDLNVFQILAIKSTSDLGSTLNNITSMWSVILAFAAVAAFIILAYMYDFTSTMGRIWLLFAIGTAFWFGGEFIWFYLVLTEGGIPDSISLADISWLLGYPVFIIGLFLLNKEINLAINKNTKIGFYILWAIFSSIILLVLGNAMFTPDAILLDSIVYYAYIIGDLIILLLVGLLVLKFSGGAEIRKSYFLLIVGFFATALGDIIYAITAYILAIYQTYAFDFADALFIWGYTLLTVGAITYYYLVSKVLAD